MIVWSLRIMRNGMRLCVNSVLFGLMFVSLQSYSDVAFKMITPPAKELWIYPVCEVFQKLLPDVNYMDFPGGELGDESGIKWIPSIPVSKDKYLSWIDRYQQKKLENKLKKKCLRSGCQITILSTITKNGEIKLLARIARSFYISHLILMKMVSMTE